MPMILNLKSRGKPVLRGQEHYWSVIMAHLARDEPFTARDIMLSSNANRSSVHEYLRRLEAGGLIRAVEGGFRATERRGSAPRLRRDGSIIESVSANTCMWNLMRGPTGRAGFTFRDLVHWASTDETVVSAWVAQTYIRSLAAAGYLIEVEPGRSGRPGVWRLDPRMNSGPYAPKLMRAKLVWDPNRQDVTGPATADEVQS